MTRSLLLAAAGSLLALSSLSVSAAETAAEPHVMHDHPAVIIAKRAIPTEGESAGTGNIYPHPAWGFLRLEDPSHTLGNGEVSNKHGGSTGR